MEVYTDNVAKSVHKVATVDLSGNHVRGSAALSSWFQYKRVARRAGLITFGGVNFDPPVGTFRDPPDQNASVGS